MAHQKALALIFICFLLGAYIVPAKPQPLPPKKDAVSLSRYMRYLYVWEFNKGKLLLVKENKGKYSAEVYLPKTRGWHNLQDISRQELREIINEAI